METNKAYTRVKALNGLVAYLEPVPLGAGVVSQAVALGLADFQRKDVRVGDMVEIRRGGSGVVRIESVDLAKRPGEAVKHD